MHIEAAGRFRNIAVAQLVNALDVLPPHAVGRHWSFGRRRFGPATGKERGLDGVRIGRLGQVVHGTGLHGRDRGCDVPITREHDDTHIIAQVSQDGHDVKPVAVIEAHVEDGIGRRMIRRQSDRLRDGGRRADRKTPLLHRPPKAVQERQIVIDKEKRTVQRRAAQLALRLVVPSLGYCHLRPVRRASVVSTVFNLQTHPPPVWHGAT